jgi:hypothetical protein
MVRRLLQELAGDRPAGYNIKAIKYTNKKTNLLRRPQNIPNLTAQFIFWKRTKWAGALFLMSDVNRSHR